jgi:hypothetical protein
VLIVTVLLDELLTAWLHGPDSTATVPATVPVVVAVAVLVVVCVMVFVVVPVVLDVPPVTVAVTVAVVAYVSVAITVCVTAWLAVPVVTPALVTVRPIKAHPGVALASAVTSMVVAPPPCPMSMVPRGDVSAMDCEPPPPPPAPNSVQHVEQSPDFHHRE